MNKELPEASRREFFPLLPPTPHTPKEKGFKVPKDTEGKRYNPDLQNRSKPQTFHGRVCVAVSIKGTTSATKRGEKRDVFI